MELEFLRLTVSQPVRLGLLLGPLTRFYLALLFRLIPTERPPLVGEVSASFCGYRVPLGQREVSLWPHSQVSRPEPLLFYQVATQLFSRG
jgi:hypothetical protein